MYNKKTLLFLIYFFTFLLFLLLKHNKRALNNIRKSRVKFVNSIHFEI